MTIKKIACVAFTCLIAAQTNANEIDGSVAAVTEAVQVAVVEAETSLDATSTGVSQADIDEQNALSDSSTKDITPQTMQDFFDEFAKKHSIHYNVVKNGKVFFHGSAAVSLPATDPNFSKALNIAFDKASLAMQTEFVRNTFGSQSSEIAQKVFLDTSTNAREFEKLPAEGRFAQLVDKVVQLTGAQLDNALEELGVQPQDLTQERKKELALNSIVQQISESAFGNMQGLVPVQTSMTELGDGYYEVGVIAVMSPKTKQVANDMRRKRASLITGKGQPLNDVLPETNEAYVNEHGIRLVYDENGAPVVISYGQWSYETGRNPAITSRNKNIAIKQATARADAAVSAFINTSLQMKMSNKVGEILKNTITETRTGTDVALDEQDTNDIIDIINEEVTSRSSTTLRGLGTLKTWSTKDANGITYAGAVRYYSYGNVENANNMIAPSASQSNKTQSAPKATQSVTRKSRVVNDMDDF